MRCDKIIRVGDLLAKDYGRCYKTARVGYCYKVEPDKTYGFRYYFKWFSTCKFSGVEDNEKNHMLMQHSILHFMEDYQYVIKQKKRL